MFEKEDRWRTVTRSYFFKCVFSWNGLGRWVIDQLGMLKALVGFLMRALIQALSVVLLYQP